MSTTADLEIGLHHYDSKQYVVEFRFSPPNSEGDIRLGQSDVMTAQFDLAKLGSLIYDPLEYGKLLTAGLFSDPSVKSAFAQAFAAAQSNNLPLRVQLMIGPSAPELHALHWETLRDPADGSPLCTNQNILFSRYLSSLDWRPVRLRPKRAFRALLAVANPKDLSEFDLDPVDVPGETGRAKAAMKNVVVDTLPDDSGSKRTTLKNIIDSLNGNDYDVLYLVAHGALIKEEAWLWLEDDEGCVARAAGSDLVTRLKELEKRPRLVVLASCQSAGKEDANKNQPGEALAALGPRLAEAGIPAVLAMQGNISPETVAVFMPEFFKGLTDDGKIDQAAAVARGAVRERSDAWMPALFMRLKSGRIWYLPGFGEDRKDFEKWPSLLQRIEDGQCTPILGPGLTEPIIGSLHDLARRWAENYHYPMAPYERESLPQVAQYLTINQDAAFPLNTLKKYLRQELLEKYGQDLSEDLQKPNSALDDVLDAVGRKRWQENPEDPYSVLARLPLPVYITTNYNHLLVAALKDAGKDPQMVVCPWNENIMQPRSIYSREPDYYPTCQRPLVYQLFGSLSVRDSVVLTEDDYFDFLIGITGNKDLIPAEVRAALANTSLLFLGFQMDEWNFRVLFRSILAQQGSGRRDRYTHIAAQIEPEEGRLLSPVNAQRYLENYFKAEYISIFWGTADDFIKQLWQNWQQYGSGECHEQE